MKRRTFLTAITAAATAPMVALAARRASPPARASSGMDELLAATESEIFLYGEPGSGKTRALMAWLESKMGDPQFRGLMVCRDHKGVVARLLEAPQWCVYRLGVEVIVYPRGGMLYLAPLGEVENYYGLEFNRVAIDDAPRDWSLAEYERIRAMCRSGSRPQTVVAYGPPGPEWVTQGNGITRNGGRPYLGPHVTVLVSHRRRRWIYLPLGANDGPSFISYATAPAKTSPIT